MPIQTFSKRQAIGFFRFSKKVMLLRSTNRHQENLGAEMRFEFDCIIIIIHGAERGAQTSHSVEREREVCKGEP